MTQRIDSKSRPGLRSAVLLALVIATGAGLAAWKVTAAEGAAPGDAAEPVEVVTAAVAAAREHREVTTAIGTVLATRSVSLRNELPGTVRRVNLVPGQVVGTGAVLVALDVSVEEAELRAQQAKADLARTTLARYERMLERQAASAIERDNVRAELDIAEAEIARVRAIIERKTIRAPFPGRVGLADIHPGQFLDAGTLLTTLQGVDDAVDVDFHVAQDVAARLTAGETVEVLTGAGDAVAIPARITAVDARVDPATRNTAVRVRVDAAGEALRPGGSVRVRVPVGATTTLVAVPASALRRGPSGDHVFVLESGEDGATRAHVRQVVTGSVLEDEVLVVSGLTSGERVAVSGSFKLRDGVRVQVAPGDSGDPPADGAGTAEAVTDVAGED